MDILNHQQNGCAAQLLENISSTTTIIYTYNHYSTPLIPSTSRIQRSCTETAANMLDSANLTTSSNFVPQHPQRNNSMSQASEASQTAAEYVIHSLLPKHNTSVTMCRNGTNSSSRFITSQLQLEADAREALPYVSRLNFDNS